MSETTGAWSDESRRWTADQHRQEACVLLDNLHVESCSEEWPDGMVKRHYTAVEDYSDDPVDLAPFLAAIAHALLAANHIQPVPSGALHETEDA